MAANQRKSQYRYIYSLAAPDGFLARIIHRQRLVMFRSFLELTAIEPDETVLDVGATSDRTYSSSNYLEAWYPHKSAITALGLQSAGFLASLYPGLRFVRGDGVALPFADQSFDVVHASAVIEHVGSLERQIRFLRECSRVARRAVFVTTPNRWFPVEVHTCLPFLHWLPKPAFRGILRSLGLEFFAVEQNLNLLSRSELAKIGEAIPEFAFVITTVSLWGWPSNLLVMGRRKAP
jgi:SAM-dependent methyltransferase